MFSLPNEFLVFFISFRQVFSVPQIFIFNLMRGILALGSSVLLAQLGKSSLYPEEFPND